MAFNESRTVESFVRDRLCGGITHHVAAVPGLVRKKGHVCGLGWHFLAPRNLARLPHQVMVEAHVREALIRLNHDIAAQPDRAEEVLSRLRAIVMQVRSVGLVNANEEFAAWLKGDRSMPFGEQGEPVPIRLIDFSDPERNQYVVTTQFSCRAGASERRLDLVLLVNGMPLILIEAKTHTGASRSWVEGAARIHDDYERNVAELLVPNALSVATDGREVRYGSIGLPVDRWGPWLTQANDEVPALHRIGRAIESMLQPNVIFDLLANLTLYATDEQKRRIKIVSRHEQYEATNAIVERVVASHLQKGSMWHFEGPGKSLLMLFVARKLRRHPALRNHTVMIIVDQNDLDGQTSNAFYATDMPSLVKADNRAELQRLLTQDTPRIIVTKVSTVAEGGGVLDARNNIVAMVDEARRTQDGDLPRKMRDVLPNGFLFRLTGMPVNHVRTTWCVFGAEDHPVLSGHAADTC
jgi:type I restriction enzyme R subunit